MNDGNPSTQYCSLEAAAGLVRLPATRVRRYVRAGLVRPARVEGRVELFGDVELARLRKIRRLRQDLGLNTAGVEIVLRLLDEIQTLRAALAYRGNKQDTGLTDTRTSSTTQGGSPWPSMPTS